MGVAFGKYRIIASLAQGGMADVFLAVAHGPVGFRKLVVIKRIRPDVASRSEHATMLLDEARLAARLQHPNVVQTFEVGVEQGEHYIAMEFLEGQPLGRILQAARRPPPSFTAHVLGDALAGLHYAHELADYDGRPLGIVHRDVSPQNLFVTYAGEVKVVDFGIAKATARDTEQTAAGTLKGKVAYMAPEQATGGALDRRTDVFAAGVVLWELLTGERLFKAGNDVETIARILFHEIRAPSSYHGDIPPELDAICLRALERQPEARWQTAGEMREALERYLRAAGSMRRDDIGQYVASLFEKERIKIKAQITEFMRSADAAEAAGSFDSLRTLRLARSEPPPTSVTMGAATAVNRSWPPSSVPPPANAGSSGPTVTAPRAAGGGSTALVAGLLGAVLAVSGVVAFVVRPRMSSKPRPAVAVHADAGEQTEVAPAPALRLKGAGTIGVGLAPALVEAFLRKRGAESVERRPSGAPEDTVVIGTSRSGSLAIAIDSAPTTDGFAALGDRTCDVAMAAREIHPAEAAQLEAKGLGSMRSPASEHTIALDGVAVVVHPSNPIGALERSKIRSAFTGEVKDWSGLGGAPGPIEVVTYEEGSGTLDVVRNVVLGGQALTASAVRLPTNDGIAERVASNPLAIGFVGLAFVRQTKPIAIYDPGVAPKLPTPLTVTTEAYALTRRLYLYTPAKPTALALELVDFVLSPDGQNVVRAAGFVDLGVAMKSAEPCEHCPPKYAALTKRARRLSLDFRFHSNTKELDSRAVRDLDRVVSFLRGTSSGRVLLLGFAEPGGDPRAAQRLSRELARAVDVELAARGLRASVVDGFGGEMPLAAGDDDAVRTKNRRVEIWVQPDAP